MYSIIINCNFWISIWIASWSAGLTIVQLCRSAQCSGVKIPIRHCSIFISPSHLLLAIKIIVFRDCTCTPYDIKLDFNSCIDFSLTQNLYQFANLARNLTFEFYHFMLYQIIELITLQNLNLTINSTLNCTNICFVFCLKHFNLTSHHSAPRPQHVVLMLLTQLICWFAT